MNIYQTLHSHLYKAMKEQDVARKRVLRLLLSSLKFAEVAKGSELDETEVLGIIQKEIKTKNETLADARKANRQDLIEESEDDIRILEEYLPEQISPEELHQVANQVIEGMGATSIKDMGNVMKILIARLAGSATNQDASKAVRDILQNK